MNVSQRQLSNVAKTYLNTFYQILDRMIQGMNDAKLGKSISHNFIVQMIPHHEAAIEMSRNILKYTVNLSLQRIAQQIIAEQTKSIENMRRIADDCEALCNSPQELCLYQRKNRQILNAMFSAMENARFSNRVNCNFMWEMIPHHKGAVEMSQNALQFDLCPQLKPILEAIITSQKKGICQMQRLLCLLDC